MDMPRHKAPKSIIGLRPIAILAVVITLAAIVYLFTKDSISAETKANADFICSAYDKTIYLPADQKNIPLNLTQNAVAFPASAGDDPMDEFRVFDRRDGTLFYGYNETGKQISMTDYIIRGASFSTPGSFIRGGRLGGDRSEEFLTRGVQIGDSWEDVLRILGEPEEEGIEMGFTTDCPFYYFNAEYGGRYRLAIHLEGDTVSLIRLLHSYNDEFFLGKYVVS